MPEPGRWRGRLTRTQNAILIALMVVGVPIVTFGLMTLDDRSARLAVIAGWGALIGIVAGIFRLRFERMNRR